MLTLPAPLKLNLFLHVTGRRADGYHTLETLFQLLDHGDLLQFDPRGPGLTLTCNEPALLTEDNLVLRAARLLQPQARRPAQCRIHLDKRVPAGSGLGGGSSDAATTLLGLNALWDCGLDIPSLCRLGLQLGADVPVFVNGHAALAVGVGEILENQQLPEHWYLVLTPSCHLSTREIFQHPELTRNGGSTTMRAFPFWGSRNDCEAVAFQLFPQVAQAKNWLARQVAASADVPHTPWVQGRMTGTGASVFASFTRRESAEAVLAKLALDRQHFDPGCRGFVARAVNRSPLQEALAAQSGA